MTLVYKSVNFDPLFYEPKYIAGHENHRKPESHGVYKLPQEIWQYDLWETPHRNIIAGNTNFMVCLKGFSFLVVTARM